MKTFVEIILWGILLIALGYCVVTVVDLFGSNSATIDAVAQDVSMSAQVETPVSDTATPAPVERTRAAGEAALLLLAVESTRVSIEIMQSAATQQAAIVETDAEIDRQRTSEAIYEERYQGAKLTQQADNERAAAATETEIVRQATQAALDEAIQTMQYRAEIERAIIPWSLAWEGIVRPFVSFVLIVFGVIIAVVRIWKFVARRIDSADYRPQPAEVAEYEPDEQEDSNEPDALLKFEIKRGAQLSYLELPATAEQLYAVAVGVLRGNRDLTDADWVGQHGFSRRRWSRLRRTLVENGLAIWQNPEHHDKGARLTTDGLGLLEQILAAPPPPPAPPSENND